MPHDVLASERIRQLSTAVAELEEKIKTLQKENAYLRGLVQCNEDWRCIYGFQLDHIAACPRGFPGCACADDLVAFRFLQEEANNDDGG